MGKSAAISRDEGWKWGGKGPRKGAGWDRAGEWTSDLWPGKAEGQILKH